LALFHQLLFTMNTEKIGTQKDHFGGIASVIEEMLYILTTVKKLDKLILFLTLLFFSFN
jgi:hypothetical protein